MSEFNIKACVKFTVEGFHKWIDATEHRAYLANLHRHLFHIEAIIELHHEEREIEYHDFLDFCKEHFKGGNMNGKSCETMARELIEKIALEYPERFVEVRVFEDGEVGAIVSLKSEQETPRDG